VQAGADALGLVFYPPSPRCVDLPTAARLARAVPPFVSIVGLFVNADPADLRATLAPCRSTCCNSTVMRTKPIAGSSIDLTSRQRASGRESIWYNTRLLSLRRRPSFSTPLSTVTVAAAGFRLVAGAVIAGQAADPLRWAGCGQCRRSGAPSSAGCGRCLVGCRGEQGNQGCRKDACLCRRGAGGWIDGWRLMRQVLTGLSCAGKLGVGRGLAGGTTWPNIPEATARIAVSQMQCTLPQPVARR
jgi:hypothetical protein